MQGHTDSVWTVPVTIDNKYVISGSSDKTIRVWNLLKKKQETVLEGHASYVWTVAVISDNQILFLALVVLKKIQII